MFSVGSLHGKLLAILIPLMIAVSGAVFVAAAVLAYRDGNRSLLAKLTEVGEVEASALAAPLFNYDSASIQRILQALSFDPDVSYVGVRDLRGRVLAEAGDADARSWEADLVLMRPIRLVVAGSLTILGDFIVVFNRNNIHRVVLGQLLTQIGLLAVLLAALVIGAWLAYRHTIGIPLRRLLDSIRRDEREGGTEAVRWSSRDELGEVVQAYNQMLMRRAKAESALRESEERLRAIADATPVALLISRISDGLVVYANPQASIVFGLAPGDMIGRDALALYGDPARQETVQAAVMGNGQDRSLELELRTAQGTPFPALALFRAMTFEDAPAVLSTVYDITDRKRGEEALRAAKTAAELADRSKTEFLANMSHELRTPLNAIIGFSEMIERELFGPLGAPRYRDYVADILGSARHLLAVINDILSVARLEAGTMELVEGEVDIGAACRACLKLVAARAWEGRVILDDRLPAELPRLWGDETKFKQILLNLLSNAIKFTPESGRVALSAALDPAGGLLLTIADTGAGMAATELDQIMIPFRRAGGAYVRNNEGAGLGLPLSKALAELHGGTLTLASEPGRGTIARLWLPKSRLLPSAIAQDQGASSRS